MLTIPMLLAAFPPPPAEAVADEAALVRRAQDDLSAFSELYRLYVQRVYRYILVRVGNEQDAQDLTSQTFVAAMESLDRYRGQSGFLAWLFGIARHKTADYRRHATPQVELEAAYDLADGHHTDEIAGRHLQIEQIARKLRTLSPERAEAIALRLFAGLEVKEIARALGKNPPAVRMLVYRGLQDLQAQLNEEAYV